MSDPTERLRAGADIVAQRQKIPRVLLFPLLREAADTIDALLAHPDDLLAVMVEAGVLTIEYACNICGTHEGNRSTWCNAGCGSDYNRMIPVYRRIEGTTP